MVIGSFFLDASAMVKLVADEKGSAQVRICFNDTTNIFSTTNFCFLESLSVLKRKWLKKKITQNEYRRFCRLLFDYTKTGRIDIVEYPLKSLHDFNKLECLVEEYCIDISDALQLVSIKETYLAVFVQESETILLTSDKHLAECAEKEGIKAEYIS